ncbi:MAG: hypothetical protein ACFFBD_25745, partial [Candidatus Hodarchaeota archaeon]
WKVSVGDSKTFVFEEYYNNDPNTTSYQPGNPNQQIRTVTDENGDTVNVTIEKGSTMKITITSLAEYSANGTITYNGKVTTKSDWAPYIDTTTHNLTFWEEYVDYMNDLVAGSPNSIEGNLLITEGHYSDMEGRNNHILIKFNWKTGWWEYVSLLVRNSEGIRLYEFVLATSPLEFPSFDILPVIMGLFIVIPVFSTIKKRKRD